MKLSFLIGLFFLTVQTVFGQHLYPEKYDECELSQFCLDCGEPKAELPKDAVESVLDGFNRKALKKIKWFNKSSNTGRHIRSCMSFKL